MAKKEKIEKSSFSGIFPKWQQWPKLGSEVRSFSGCSMWVQRLKDVQNNISHSHFLQLSDHFQDLRAEPRSSLQRQQRQFFIKHKPQKYVWGYSVCFYGQITLTVTTVPYWREYKVVAFSCVYHKKFDSTPREHFGDSYQLLSVP